MRFIGPALLVLALAACGGNPLNNGGPGSGSSSGGGTTTTGGVTVPAALAKDLASASYDATADTLTVKMSSLDAGAVNAVYTRNAALDVPGFKAYSSQQSPLDRLFIALAATTADGAVTATVAGDGGQNNTYFSGTSFGRSGVASALPTSGEAKFAGSYAGLTNIAAPGNNLLAAPVGTDPSLLPSEAERTQGDGFLIVNFADNAVNGTIYNRQFADGSGTLDSLALTPGTLDSNGQFTGTVEFSGRHDLGQQGNYGGALGGTGLTGAAGSVVMNSVYPSDNANFNSAQREVGVFVLSSCALAGAPAVCAAAQAP
jgi:hypothetical protein